MTIYLHELGLGKHYIGLCRAYQCHTEFECRVSPDVLECRYCNMDFQVEIKKVGDEELALVITKWLDLGSGLTPMDPMWRAHLGSHRAAERAKVGEAGVIRLRFESEPGPSLDSLSRQNALYLNGKRFMGAMDRLYHRTWILQGSKRLLSFCYSDRIFFSALF
jgi:hypothetical protein